MPVGEREVVILWMFESWIITRAPEIQENTRLMYKGSGEHEETGHDVFLAFRASYGIGQRLYIDNKLLFFFFFAAQRWHRL